MMIMMMMMMMMIIIIRLNIYGIGEYLYELHLNVFVGK